jgi:hypothetical protein
MEIREDSALILFSIFLWAKNLHRIKISDDISQSNDNIIYKKIQGEIKLES